MLLDAGHDVTGVDTGYFREQALPPDTDQMRNVNKDIRDLDGRDLKGIDAVIHLAALSNDPMGNLNEDWTYEINHAHQYAWRTGPGCGRRRFSVLPRVAASTGWRRATSWLRRRRPFIL